MRPEEIDYSDTRKHYFDLSNGEILVGEGQLKAYLAVAADTERVVDVGKLLRTKDDNSLRPEGYEMPNRKGLAPEVCKQYGKWLLAIVNPDLPPEERSIDGHIIRMAARLGLGVGLKAIDARFDGRMDFYQQIGSVKLRRSEVLSDLSLQSVIEYVKQVGQKAGCRPTREMIDAHTSGDVTRPTSKYIHRKAKEIGGFNKVVELAGNEVVRLWGRDDHIDWGIRFMEANDGLLPSAEVLRFVASKRLGPGQQIIYKFFDSIPDYQRDVSQKYWELERMRIAQQDTKIKAIQAAYKYGSVPPELFNRRTPESLEGPLTLQETFARYAKYLVAQMVVPQLDKTAWLELALANNKGFVSQVRKKQSKVTTGEIEHAALLNEVFDDIWPLGKDHIDKLKLGKDFRCYQIERERKQKAYRERKRLQEGKAIA